MLKQVTDAQWTRLSEVIAERTGLHFPPERRADLERAMLAAAPAMGFDDVAASVEALLAAPLTKSRLQALAAHLTIGETYFFRDRAILDALTRTILPELIASRRGREQRLRLWSAASCTGEEAYTLAILLHELLPDISGWQVTITATDVNPRFLAKAAAGVYREWSFRDAPPGLKGRWFERTIDGAFAVRPEIRKLVTFSYLNLVEDAYPSLLNETNAMDVIFCRNVLMYFTPAQSRKVVGNLRRALVDGGVLVVSPSEASQTLFSDFAPVNYPGAIMYRKPDERAATRKPPVPVVSAAITAPAAKPQRTRASREESQPADATSTAQALYDRGRYADAADALLRSLTARLPTAHELSLLARALANQGRLDEALAWCERWVAGDKLDPNAHFLRANVLLEQGDADEARLALQRAIFLAPDFVLAHYALGNVARSRGNPAEGAKHFANALRLLRARGGDEVLPESDGLTAGRLAEIITATSAVEDAR